MQQVACHILVPAAAAAADFIPASYSSLSVGIITEAPID